jgi:serine/threonine-protein kinase
MWRSPGVATLVAGCVLAVHPLAAQCPDGSAPPCKSTPRSLPAANSIAVLYFDNLTRDSAYAYLADGLTEELISRLGLVQRLDVKSRFESLRVRDRRGAGAAELGRELHAAYLLSGSVQPAAGRMRVTVELVRAASDTTVWRGLLNGAGGDLLAAQESIATAVVQAVAGQLLPQERTALGQRATRDSAAYDLYLRGRVLVSRLTEPDVRHAMELYRQALARDSTFALAWAGIAQTWVWLADNWLAPLEAYPRAREAAERALALDSSVALAYQALAFSVQVQDHDFARAEALARRAVALDPRLADAHASLGQILVIRGRPAEALAEAQRAWELDSLSLIGNANRSWALMVLGRTREALAEARAHHDVYDEAWALVELQRCEEARSAVRRWSQEDRESWWYWWILGVTGACIGQRDEAHAALDSLATLARRRYAPPTLFAAIHATLGEADQAFEWLDRGYEGRDWYILFVNRQPWLYQSVQADPRWVALMRRIGLSWPAPELPP